MEPVLQFTFRDDSKSMWWNWFKKKKKKALAEFLLEKFFKVQMEYNAWMQFYLHFIWETLVPLQK